MNGEKVKLFLGRYEIFKIVWRKMQCRYVVNTLVYRILNEVNFNILKWEMPS